MLQTKLEDYEVDQAGASNPKKKGEVNIDQEPRPGDASVSLGALDYHSTGTHQVWKNLPGAASPDVSIAYLETSLLELQPRLEQGVEDGVEDFLYDVDKLIALKESLAGQAAPSPRGDNWQKQSQLQQSLWQLQSGIEQSTAAAVKHLLGAFRDALEKNKKSLDALGLKQQLEKRVTTWQKRRSKEEGQAAPPSRTSTAAENTELGIRLGGPLPFSRSASDVAPPRAGRKKPSRAQAHLFDVPAAFEAQSPRTRAGDPRQAREIEQEEATCISPPAFPGFSSAITPSASAEENAHESPRLSPVGRSFPSPPQEQDSSRPLGRRQGSLPVERSLGDHNRDAFSLFVGGPSTPEGTERRGRCGGGFCVWSAGDEGLWLPSNEVPLLRRIAKRLSALGAGDQCLEVYRKVRSQALLGSLKAMEMVELRVAALDALPWPEMEGCMKAWVADLSIVAYVLLEGERRLCEIVFSGLCSSRGGGGWQGTLSLLLLESRFHRAIIMLCLNLQSLLKSRRSPEKVFWFLNILRVVEEVTPMFTDVLRSAQKQRVLDEWLGLEDAVSDAVLGTLQQLRDMLREPIPVLGPSPSQLHVLGAPSNQKGGLFSVGRLLLSKVSSAESMYQSTRPVDVSVHPVTSYVVNYIIKLMERDTVLHEKLQRICRNKPPPEESTRSSDQERVAGRRHRRMDDEVYSGKATLQEQKGILRSPSDRTGGRVKLVDPDSGRPKSTGKTRPKPAGREGSRERPQIRNSGGGQARSSSAKQQQAEGRGGEGGKKVSSDNRLRPKKGSGNSAGGKGGSPSQPQRQRSGGSAKGGSPSQSQRKSGSNHSSPTSHDRQPQSKIREEEDRDVSPRSPSPLRPAEGGLEAQVSALLSALEENVAARGRSLQGRGDAVGPALFCLNNAHYLSRCIDLCGRSEAAKHLRWVKKMEGEFEHAALGKLAASLDHPNSGHRKDLNEVKTRLRAFNNCFEELALDQRNWVILSDAHRWSLRTRFARRVNDMYSLFLTPHRDVVGELQTYRWTPEGLERTILRTFFLTASTVVV